MITMNPCSGAKCRGWSKQSGDCYPDRSKNTLCYIDKRAHLVVSPGFAPDSDLNHPIWAEIRVQRIWGIAARIADYPGAIDLVVKRIMHMTVDP